MELRHDNGALARRACDFMATPSLITGDVLAAMQARKFRVGHKVLPCQVGERQTPRETGTGAAIGPFTALPAACVKPFPWHGRDSDTHNEHGLGCSPSLSIWCSTPRVSRRDCWAANHRAATEPPPFWSLLFAAIARAHPKIIAVGTAAFLVTTLSCCRSWHIQPPMSMWR